MEIVEKIRKFNISIKEDDGSNEITLLCKGDFERLSAFPVEKHPDQVWVKFFSDGRVKYGAGYAIIEAGNEEVTYDIEGFFYAIRHFRDVMRNKDELIKENEKLKEKVKELQKENDELRDKIRHLYDEIDALKQQRQYSPVYPDVYYPVKNDKELRAVLNKILFKR